MRGEGAPVQAMKGRLLTSKSTSKLPTILPSPTVSDRTDSSDSHSLESARPSALKAPKSPKFEVVATKDKTKVKFSDESLISSVASGSGDTTMEGDLKSLFDEYSTMNINQRPSPSPVRKLYKGLGSTRTTTSPRMNEVWKMAEDNLSASWSSKVTTHRDKHQQFMILGASPKHSAGLPNSHFDLLENSKAVGTVKPNNFFPDLHHDRKNLSEQEKDIAYRDFIMGGGSFNSNNTRCSSTNISTQQQRQQQYEKVLGDLQRVRSKGQRGRI